MEETLTHPMAGSITGQYFANDDGTVKVPAIFFMPEVFKNVCSDLASYKWNETDFLIATYPKNGTHFVWEVMTMLINGSADYIGASKKELMIDAFPVKESAKVFPSPRVLNTHYRTDVLPAEFRKAKTVVVMRNPKDTCVSYYYHVKNIVGRMSSAQPEIGKMSFQQFLGMFLDDKDVPYGRYFEYIEYMWSLRDEPNVLLIFYEDLKLDPVGIIQKVNEFMGTDRSPELVQQIADATNFSKMKKGKTGGPAAEEMVKMIKAQNLDEKEIVERMNKTNTQIYRKGGIGDWKNHFTVADNEMFDHFLANWEGGRDIPFKY
ncbi:sulfotransferase 1C2-like [Watersipora subatra]|uniref:sulfotransferase 1C2-like n=1 Tax=Watersipora subatra TaxID=2589382 RepID=UPI00355C35FD